MNIDVTEQESDTFVSKQLRLGNKVRWDGWDMVFFLPARRASFVKDGVYNKKYGWGFEHRVPVDSTGTWRVPKRYVKVKTVRN